MHTVGLAKERLWSPYTARILQGHYANLFNQRTVCDKCFAIVAKSSPSFLSPNIRQLLQLIAVCEIPAY